MKKSRQKNGMTICFIFFAVIFVTSSSSSQTLKTSTSLDNPIKIGGSLPLTGIYSEVGKWVKAGYDYWAEDVNKRGGLLGRPVRLTVYDDEGSAEKAVTYYERAITIDKVDLICGGHPMVNPALMPVVERHRMVFIGAGGAMKSFEQGFTYSFGSPPLISDWFYVAFAGVLDDLIPKAAWPKTLAILTMNNVMGLAGRGNLIKAAEEHGIKVVVDEIYNLPLSDATPLVSKAKANGAEIFCSLSYFDDGVMGMRAAKAMRYNPKLIMQQLASRMEPWLRELGEDGDNVLGHSSMPGGLPYPGNQQIFEGARKKLGLPAPPDFFAMGYCFMYTLEVGVQGSGSLNNAKIKDYMRSHKFDLPYGKGITFDSKGLPSPFAFMVQTTKGQNKIVWPKEVATGKLVYPRPGWNK